MRRSAVPLILPISASDKAVAKPLSDTGSTMSFTLCFTACIAIARYLRILSSSVSRSWKQNKNCNQQKNHCEPTNKRRKKLKTIEPLCIQRQLSISVRCQNTKMEQCLSSKPDVKMCSGTSSKESGCGGAGAVPGSDDCPDSFFSFSTSCLISFASKMTTHVTHVACLSKSQRPYHYKSMFSFLKAQLSLTNSSIPPYSRASAAVLRFFKACLSTGSWPLVNTSPCHQGQKTAHVKTCNKHTH